MIAGGNGSDEATRRPRRGDRRRVLLLTTALCAAFASTHAQADPAPNARPQGGIVSAGGAKITSGATTTTITQSTPRAVVDWQGFDVGRNQSVVFVQPSSTATTLNRVNAAEPSQIAGKITANGQIIIENRSGIIFTESAQIDARALVATASGIGTDRFMAGGTRFDVPARDGAAVVNRGRITVAETGLAALVAPRVSNSGVIEAKHGRIVLAGAATHTVDLYGDGLLSIDIGADARVANTGTLRAEGGRVRLSAAAADGIVSGLVEAGGRIAADSTAGRTGSVQIAAIGGSVIVSGQVSAAGTARGTTGGTIAVVATGTVTLAAGSRVDASGRKGGGTIAIGRSGAVTAARTEIRQGASVTADATRKGQGGTITVMSSQATSMAGRITATGGPQGGAGGFVEVSGARAYALTGAVDVSAAAGEAGTLLIDPQDLTIQSPGADGALLRLTGTTDGRVGVANNGTSGIPISATIDPAVFESLTGNVVLQAARDMFVLSPVDANAASLSLQAGRNLTVAAPMTLTGGGTIALSAAVGAFSGAPGYDAAGPSGVLRVTPTGSLTALGGRISMLSGAGGISLDGPVQAASVTTNISGSGPLVISSTVQAGNATLLGGRIDVPGTITGTTLLLGTPGGSTISITGTVAATGTLTLIAGTAISAPGHIQAGMLTLSATSARFSDASNAIDTLGAIATSGGFDLVNGRDLTILGGVLAGGVLAPNPANVSALNITVDGRLAIGQASGSAGVLNAGTVALSATGGITQPNGTIGANLLTGTPPGAAASLPGVSLTGANTVVAVSGFATTGNFALTNSRDLAVTGAITAGTVPAPSAANTASIDLTVGGALAIGPIGRPGGLNAGTIRLLASGAITQPAGFIAANLLLGPGAGLAIGSATSATLTGANFIITLGSFTTSGDFQLRNGQALTVAGTLSAGGSGGASGANSATVELSAAGDLAIGKTGGLALINAGTLSLLATGTISQPNGSIITDLLTGTSSAIPAASAQLRGNNIINRLGRFSVLDAFALADGRPLVVAGTVIAGAGATGTGRLSLVGGSSIAIGRTGTPGVLSAGTVSLVASGGISEPNGIISTSLLLGPAIGEVFQAAASATLTGSNAITAIGAFNTVGNFTLTNFNDLAIRGVVSAGVLTAPNPANSATLAITVNGNIVLGPAGTAARLNAGTVALLATGTVSEPAGVITANTLTDFGSSRARAIVLNGANVITQLGAFGALGNLNIINTVPLTITGLVTAGGLAAPDPLNTGILDLRVAAGGLTIGQAAGSEGGNAGTLNAGTVVLTVPGTISQPNGAITANLLTGVTSGGTLVLADAIRLPGANAIATLGSLAAAGDVFINNTTGLTVISSVTAGGIATPLAANTGTLTIATAGTLSLGQSAASGGGAFPGSLTGGTVALLAGGAISEPNGVIRANLLTGPDNAAPAASAALTGANTIAALGVFNTAGDFTLGNTTGVTIVGSVAAGGAVGPGNGATLSIAAAGPITIGTTGQAGRLSGGTVMLLTNATISEPNGGITANLMTTGASTATAIDLSGSNTIAAIGTLTANGDITVADAVGLNVLGTISAGGSTAPDLANSATLELRLTAGLALGQGSVEGVLNAGTVVLVAGGAITAPNGRITANLLTSPGVASTALGGANSITAVGGFIAAGSLILQDIVPLTLDGPIRTGGDLVVASTGALTLNGRIAASGSGDSLFSGDSGVRQSAGTITTSGRATLTSANGGFVQDIGAAIVAASLGGRVSVATLHDIGLGGVLTVTSGVVNLVSAGGLIAETITGGVKGVINAGTLTGAAPSGDVLLDNGTSNRLAALSNFTAGGRLVFANFLSTTLSGVIAAGADMAISGAQQITQAGGVLSAGSIRIATGTAFRQATGAQIVASDAGGTLAIAASLGINAGGTLSAATGTVALTSTTGGIAGNFGSGAVTARVIADVLTASAPLGIALDPVAGNNVIAVLDGLSAVGSSGGVAVSSTTSLVIRNEIAAKDAIRIASLGDLTVNAGIAVASERAGVTLAAAHDFALLPGASVSGAAASLSAPRFIGISGAVSGDKIHIGGPGGTAAAQVVTTSGASLTTGTAGIYDTSLALAGWPSSATATGGAFIVASGLNLSGTLPVLARSGVATPTLRMDIARTGNFDTGGGLRAETATVFINLGAGATVAGPVYIDGLYLAYSKAAGGSADLIGTVRGVGGQAAAQIGFIAPLQNAGYRLNSCPIASVSCFVVTTERLPQTNPIRDLDLRPARDPVDETEVLLPNVAARDF